MSTKSLDKLNVIELSEQEYLAFNGAIMDAFEFLEALEGYNKEQKDSMKYHYIEDSRGKVIIEVLG